MIDFMIFMAIYVNIKMLDVELRTKIGILLKARIEVKPFCLQTGIFSQNRLQTELLFSIMRYENHPKKGTGPAKKCVYFTARPLYMESFYDRHNVTERTGTSYDPDHQPAGIPFIHGTNELSLPRAALRQARAALLRAAHPGMRGLCVSL